MGKQATEILKGTLEGIVLAILSGQPAYGYEITARLREMGFSDIAEGTVYALLIRIEQRGLVDVEKHPSEKGPPRKVYSLNAQGQEYLEEFWRTCPMGKQVTEMLKGTLEGIVLAILSGRPAYGYEITAWLREQGFSDIAEGTVYALLIRIEQRGLVDVEKVPSEKGPPRKVYSLNDQGHEHLEAFWRTWSFLAERLEQLREGGN